jgi:hypothetical protein
MKSTKLTAAHPPLPLYADTHTFIVRIWQERTGDSTDEEEWRGLITHVDSDRRQYFFDLSGIRHFIQEQTGIGCPSRLPWWRGLFSWMRNEKK